MADLDRVVTLTVDIGGSARASGEYAPNNVELTVWARRTDTGADLLLETGGARGELRRTYRLRYDRRIVSAIEAGRRVRLDDPDSELTTGLVTLAEPRDTRQRWLDLTMVGSA